MANPEHLKILEQGVEAWNKWRDKNRDTKYDVDVIAPDLSGANLSGANLRGANLRRANLCYADLRNAYLSNTHLRLADLTRARLSGADLTRAHLRDADLRGARLGGAHLSGAHLNGAHLSLADLSGAHLGGADLSLADLSNTHLRLVDLRFANLSGANLANADFLDVYMGYTVIGNVNLNEAKNLESVRHEGPSSIGIDTIYKSRGNIPEEFLRGCGVPDDFITYMKSLTVKAIEFYSCFISYSSKDDEFAERLHADLQSKGVRCWFAPEDLKIGDRFRVRIDEAVRLYDKLLLVLSENSVASQWVEKEVETALEKEEEQGKTVLFPVRLDGAVLESKTGWAADVRRSRHIGDFSDWKNHDSYRKGFERLMRDLKAEARRES